MIRSCTPSLKFVFSTCATTDHLVVGLVLDPTAGVSSDEHLSDFIIGEDDEREGHWDEPPSPLEWVHSKHSVSSWAVSEERSQKSLLHKTGDEDLVLHSLLEDGESSGLADKDIGPLDDDDSGEEHSVASELDDLSLRVSPLLTVGILKSHTSLVVPVDSESHKIIGQETVLHQDDGVADEAGEGLDHTDLTVSHGDQSLVDELVSELVSWVSLHNVRLGLLVG